MADLWSSANLRRKLLNKIRRPATDEDLLEPDGVTDATWDLLSEGQNHWVEIIAATIPDAMYGAPVLMTTADGGLTYTFGNDAEAQPIYPLGHAEIRESRNGRLLIPTTDWGDGDYVPEGNRIRIPNGRTKLFSSGPYARFVTPPTKIDAAREPTLMPPFARELIVIRAAIIWANRGGLRDPNPWMLEEGIVWGRIANTLATQFHLKGAQAVDDGDGEWYHNIDTGAWYTRYA